MKQQQYIFSEESASPPQTIGPDYTGNTAQSRIYICYWCVKQQQYIFSEESASPPQTIGPDYTGTQLSPGFTFATGV